MKSILFHLLIPFFICLAASSLSLAQENEKLSPVAQKTKAIVEAAHAYVSKHSGNMAIVQNALKNDPRFSDHDEKLYIFIHCYNTDTKEVVCCGQGIRPELIGKQMGQLRTPNGRLIFHEIIQLIETQGEGWIEYDWLNPYSRTLQSKSSFIKGIVLKDGQKAWIGSGFWRE